MLSKLIAFLLLMFMVQIPAFAGCYSYPDKNGGKDSIHCVPDPPSDSQIITELEDKVNRLEQDQQNSPECPIYPYNWNGPRNPGC